MSIRLSGSIEARISPGTAVQSPRAIGFMSKRSCSSFWPNTIQGGMPATPVRRSDWPTCRANHDHGQDGSADCSGKLRR